MTDPLTPETPTGDDRPVTTEGAEPPRVDAVADEPAAESPSDDGVSRRAFVAKAVAGVAGAGAVAACGPATEEGGAGAPAVQTGQRVLWRMASSYPRSLDTIFGASELFAEEVSAMTNGRFQIRVYPAGELVPPLQVMDSVQQGVVQCGHTPSYYYVGKTQVLAFDTAVPFGRPAGEA